jgi:uncharacterized protein YjgD (DUF1641 family)
LFGKSGVELVPIFQEGAGYLERMTKEAQRLGLVLRPEQIGDIAQLDDALSLAADAIRGFSARLVAELAPSLTQAAQAAVEFLAKIDVREIANATSKAISTLGQAFALLSEAALPLANNILPAIGAGLAIANREALKVGLRGLADSFTKAALAAGGYATAAGIAAGATGILKTAVRGLLSATVVGAIGVGVGILAEKLVEYGLSGESASENVAAKMDDVSVSVRKNIAAFQEAGNAASAFGQRAREA